MIKVSKSLCTERFTSNEFKNNSVLDSSATLDDLNKKFSKIWNNNRARRMKAQKKY